MRTLILSFLFATITLSQTYQDTLFISADSLKTGSISFNQAWRYSPGDDTLWAMKDFDDSKWDTLNPRLEWEDYDTTKWNGLGWFRKYLIIDTSLRNKSVGLSMLHHGASEIYLNGDFIKQFGTVSEIPDSENVYQPHGIPIALNFGNDTNYVIAVRYSNYESVKDPEWIDSWFGNHGFILRFQELDTSILNMITNGKLNFGVNFLIGGIFLSLAVLYFLLYLFYSSKKENLYYALFSFSLSLLFPSGLLRQLVFENLTWLVIFNLISIVGVGFTFIGYLSFVYSIFYEKIPKQIWMFLTGVAIMGAMLFIFPVREYLNYFLPIFIFLATIEGFRVIIIAVKNKKEHSWVIGAGVLVFVTLILTMFIMTLFQLDIPNVIILIMFLIGLFGLPSSMSVYLARNIASTNKKLKDQVIEIKELSEKELRTQRKNAELKLQTEREVAAKNEAVLQAKAAELQAKASEAEMRALEAENARKTKELEEARNLQLAMLPKQLPEIKGLEIAVYMETATEVGGDYYDFHVSADGELTVLIGDATGHGLNAGTMVTATKSLFNTLAENRDIVEIFNQISGSLKYMNFKMLSMCLMLLKIEEKRMRISSAGMPPALIFRDRNKSVEEILIKGMPLGTAKAFPWEERETKLEKGDTILLMSDGFPELFNESQQMFGYKSVQTEFQKYGDREPEFIIEELKKSIIEWSGGKQPHDDVTFVVLKVN